MASIRRFDHKRSGSAGKTTALRVIAGSLKGRPFSSPDSRLTHPMGSREKLALFNMITSLVPGAKVLDAYAGSGALGIEALSRAAAEVVFVEQSPKIAAVIRRNLQTLLATSNHPSQPSLGQAPQPSQVEVQSSVPFTQVFPESLQKFSERPEFHAYFDLILADPPYDHFQPEELVVLAELLTADGCLVLSFPAHLEAPELPGLTKITARRYAAAGLAIYRPGFSHYPESDSL